MKLKLTISKEVLKDCSLFGYTAETPEKLIQRCPITKVIQEILPDAIVAAGHLILRHKITNRMIPTEEGSHNMVQELTFEHEDAIKLPDEIMSFLAVFDNSTPEQRINLSPVETILEIPDHIITQRTKRALKSSGHITQV